jgi:hypothetical protein
MAIQRCVVLGNNVRRNRIVKSTHGDCSDPSDARKTAAHYAAIEKSNLAQN